jgi:hypothetical protein
MQRGFAIGTVLLAVVLIAAIVSAIAIASRGNSEQGQREKDRLLASVLIQQGIDISQAYVRLIRDGYSRDEVTLTAQFDGKNTIRFNAFASDPTAHIICNESYPGYNWDASALQPMQCLFSAANGLSSISPPQDAVGNTANTASIWAAFPVGNFHDSSLNNRLTMFTVIDITPGVCRQLNNQLQNLALGAAIPVQAIWFSTFTAPTPPISLNRVGDEALVTEGGCAGLPAGPQPMYFFYYFATI